MNISQVQIINTQTPVFAQRGKPIDLKYILKNRAYLLPQRVLFMAQQEVCKTSPMSLMDIHKFIYAPLLGCKTLNEAKKLYPEFSQIAETVTFSRNSVYADKFKKCAGDNFALTMLQELWGKLRGKDEVAKELGMTNRSSLAWALDKINFVYFSSAYKTLLKASDEEGNRLIASKTQAWNALNPDLMMQKNAYAAQFCKTPEYREAQSIRIKAYDIEHPERRERISDFDRRVWALCPQIRAAMADFSRQEGSYTGSIVKKAASGAVLSPAETIVHKAFFKRFWNAYPELKEVYRQAKAQVRKDMKK